MVKMSKKYLILFVFTLLSTLCFAELDTIMVRDVYNSWGCFESEDMSELVKLVRIKDNILEIDHNVTMLFLLGENRGAKMALTATLLTFNKKGMVDLIEKYPQIKGVRLVGFIYISNFDKYGNPSPIRENLFKLRVMYYTAKKINWDYWEQNGEVWWWGGCSGGCGWDLMTGFWKNILDAKWYNPKYY